jgi:hypothetical protein
MPARSDSRQVVGAQRRQWLGGASASKTQRCAISRLMVKPARHQCYKALSGVEHTEGSHKSYMYHTHAHDHIAPEHIHERNGTVVTAMSPLLRLPPVDVEQDCCESLIALQRPSLCWSKRTAATVVQQQ